MLIVLTPPAYSSLLPSQDNERGRRGTVTSDPSCCPLLSAERSYAIVSTFNFQRTVYPSRDPAPTVFPSLRLGNKRKTRSFIILLLVGGHERGENSSMRDKESWAKIRYILSTKRYVYETPL